jgi:NADPH-dependent curcumin reductase CurA
MNSESRGINRRVLLRRRPAGLPVAEDFEIVDEPIRSLADGDVLRRTIYLSLDPYMRGRMSDEPSYAPPVALGGVMVGRTVAEVVDSKHPSFRPGEFVAANDGWQSHNVSNGRDLQKIDPARAPISCALGVLGMPGLTAYVGLVDIGRPKAGETVVVSAAAGAVGSVVGQIARIKGCRAVGVAGGAAKCEYVVKELGFDACVDYKRSDLAAALAAACPAGIDVYFDNVGGVVLKAVLPLINQNARIPLCGTIADYNATSPPPGPNLRPLLIKRAMIKGFIVSDHADRVPAFLQDCAGWIRDGKLKYREDIVEGLDNAPAAFLKLFDGTNRGKLLVRVSPDPTRPA